MHIIVILTFLTYTFFKIKYSLHMMQLETYDNQKYLAWYKKNRLLTKEKAASLLFVFLLIFFQFNGIFGDVVFTMLWMLAISWENLTYIKYKQKKPLVFTQRAKRLFFTTVIIILLKLTVWIVFSYFIFYGDFFLVLLSMFLTISVFFSELYIIFANKINKPIEKSINKKFYLQAQEKIKEIKKLVTVGITGSYGKTSTKFIVATILSERFNTLKTPHSYNTPMGISKIINNELNDTYDVFVAELGAERVGEIREVAQLVSPQIGILTSIGPCHLETFKTIENVKNTKYELIQELPENGTAIFNYDDKHVKELADKTTKSKLYYGLNNKNDVDVYADNIEIGLFGSKFMLTIKGFDSVFCETLLLGEHNILNILAGAAAAYALGMTVEEICRGIKKIEPVEHRLQLINPGTGVYVIDDAFNSNPEGAKAALKVLSKFPAGKKIIVTPGMVELGEIEYKENFVFGQNISEECDIVILIGKNKTKAIHDGLVERKFPEEQIYIVNSLNEAQSVIGNVVKSGDVVLFENDLPDTYSEKN